MIETDKKAFKMTLENLGAHYERAFETDELKRWWAALSHLSLEAFISTMMPFMTDERRKACPTLAEVIASLLKPAQSGGLSSDEAWATAIKFFDESADARMNDDIAYACGEVRELYATGDKVGARMAFKGFYDRRVAERMAKGVKPRWWNVRPEKYDRPGYVPGLTMADHIAGLLTHIEAKTELSNVGKTELAKMREKLAMSNVSASQTQDDAANTLVEVILSSPKESRAKIRGSLTPEMQRRVAHKLGEIQKVKGKDDLLDYVASKHGIDAAMDLSGISA